MLMCSLGGFLLTLGAEWFNYKLPEEVELDRIFKQLFTPSQLFTHLVYGVLAVASPCNPEAPEKKICRNFL